MSQAQALISASPIKISNVISGASGLFSKLPIIRPLRQQLLPLTVTRPCFRPLRSQTQQANGVAVAVAASDHVKDQDNNGYNFMSLIIYHLDQIQFHVFVTGFLVHCSSLFQLHFLRH